MKILNVKFYGFNLVCVVDESDKIWVVLKPVCDAIGLDSERQIKTISDDEVLGAERSEQTVQVGVDQPRKMVCLPLEFISGWLMQIKFTNTMSEETKQNLVRFKRDCYKTLFDFFFGKYTKREKSLKRTFQMQKEKKLIENNPAKTVDDFERYLSIEKQLVRERQIRKSLTIESSIEMEDLFGYNN